MSKHTIKFKKELFNKSFLNQNPLLKLVSVPLTLNSSNKYSDIRKTKKALKKKCKKSIIIRLSVCATMIIATQIKEMKKHNLEMREYAEKVFKLNGMKLPLKD